MRYFLIVLVYLSILFFVIPYTFEHIGPWAAYIVALLTIIISIKKQKQIFK